MIKKIKCLLSKFNGFDEMNDCWDIEKELWEIQTKFF